MVPSEVFQSDVPIVIKGLTANGQRWMPLIWSAWSGICRVLGRSASRRYVGASGIVGRFFYDEQFGFNFKGGLRLWPDFRPFKRTESGDDGLAIYVGSTR